MRRAVIAALAAVLCALPALADPVATVSGIGHARDGDDILIWNFDNRLEGIAAPEGNTTAGNAATAALAALVNGKQVRCEVTDYTKDGKKRLQSVCFVGGLEINREMVRAGFARDCPAFSKGRYADAEAEARADGHDLRAQYELPGYC